LRLPACRPVHHRTLNGKWLGSRRISEYIVTTVSVCLSVCPRAYLQNYASDLRRNFRARHQRSAARSSSGCVEISYVLPVLPMTSYLHLTVGNRRRISDSTRSCCTDLTPRRVLKLTHEGQHRTGGAESAIYGCGKPVLQGPGPDLQNILRFIIRLS